MEDRGEELEIRQTERALEKLRKRLLDLTSRNRLLNFKHSKLSSLRIIDELPNQLSGNLLEEKEFHFKPVPEPTKDELIKFGYIHVDPESGDEHQIKDEPTPKEWAQELGIEISYEVPMPTEYTEQQESHNDNKMQTLVFPPDLESRLRNLYRKAHSAIEESGANILFLAFGFLEWYESRDSDVPRFAPLFLLPATLRKGRLDRATNTYQYTLSYSGEDILPNLSLREKLREDFGLKLPSLDENTQPESYFEDVQELITKNKPRWKLRRFITLSLFNFSKLLMFLDLDPERWKRKSSITDHPVIRQFLKGYDDENEEEDYGISDFREEYDIDEIKDVHAKYPLIYDADSSQHSALIDTIEGKNLVIEGPPGTGKSQTITNLIAAAMANGKKVLFVAQKLAALEVVKRKLDNASLGYFCLELHSHKSQKRKVLDEIDKRIKKKGKFRKPSEIDADIDRFESIKNELRNYVKIINQPWKNTGKTIHQILMRATRYRQKLPINPSSIHPTGFNGKMFNPNIQRQSRDLVLTFVDVYKSITGQLAEGCDLQDHPWFGLKNSNLQLFDEDKVCSELQLWQQSLQELSNQIPYLAQELDCTETIIPRKISELEALSIDLTQIPQLHGDEFLDALPKLRAQDLEEFAKYLNLFESIQANYSQLSELVSQNVLEDLSRVEELIQGSNKLWELTGGGTDLHTIAVSIKNMEQLTTQLQNFIEPFQRIKQSIGEDAGGFFQIHEQGLQEFNQFVQFVAALKPAYWRLRDDCFDNDELDQVLPTIKRKLASLKATEAELVENYNTSRLPECQELEDIRRTIIEAGPFHWFNRNWRSVRKQLLQYRRSHSVKFKDLCSQLNIVIKFVGEKTKFVDDRNSHSLLGKHFNGLDTDIDTIIEIRNWYREIRQFYGIGFGRKVVLGNAIINMDSNLATNIRSLVNRELPQRIDNILENLRQLKEIYKSVDKLQCGTSDLVGEHGILSCMHKDLSIVIRQCQSALLENNISLRKLSELIGELDELRRMVNQWKSSDINQRLFDNRLCLTPGIGKSNENALSVAKRTLELALFVENTIVNHSVKTRIYNQPEPKVLNSLRERGQYLNQILEKQQLAQSKFQKMADLDLNAWEFHCNDNVVELIHRNEKALKDVRSLGNWLDYLRVRDQLCSMEFEKLINSIEKKQLKVEQTENAYLAAVYDILSREILREMPKLARFSGKGQEALQNQFKEYDNKLKNLQREKIAWKIDQNNVPRGSNGLRASDRTDLVLLKHECSKRSRHIPIRRLLERAGQALINLKPCFMMGPMSVAHYLEPGMLQFDIIVMDEASQLKPEDALGAIARGKQVVIVGDPKQLPPTNFFNRVIDGDDDEDDSNLDGSESILDAAVPIFPARRLRWHYRSRHESLIAFSNHSFYDDDLVIFPSPHNDTNEYGVHLTRVPRGRFINRKNIEEARFIAEAVRRHFRSHSKDSLGVVAMSSQQRDQIERSIEEIARAHPDFQALLDSNEGTIEPLFVKNLENVQGDERDVIFVSMTYGASEIGGRVMQRFGPINMGVGWRRLNVLFTRSRKRMRIFSSMTADDVQITTQTKRGVKALKSFLSYASTGKLLNTVVETDRAPDSDFEIAVADALQKAGFECVPQVGVAGFFIDVAVKDPGNPGRFLMGIECDGSTYHSAKSVRDRDRLRQEVLENLGWKIRRIWSTDWFKNPEAELVPIIRELDGLKTIRPIVVTPVATAPVREEQQTSYFVSDSIDLKQKLLQFDKEVIRKAFPNTPENKKLLRQDMLEALLKHRPTSGWDFRESISFHLRHGTEPKEGKFLEDVLKIIEESIHGS